MKNRSDISSDAKTAASIYSQNPTCERTRWLFKQIMNWNWIKQPFIPKLIERADMEELKNINQKTIWH